jgi:hypothetical protein
MDVVEKVDVVLGPYMLLYRTSFSGPGRTSLPKVRSNCRERWGVGLLPPSYISYAQGAVQTKVRFGDSNTCENPYELIPPLITTLNQATVHSRGSHMEDRTDTWVTYDRDPRGSVLVVRI